MQQNQLVKKLSLQSKSFQEGFEALLKCKDIEEMIRYFMHMLRGNFLITDIQFLQKSSFNSEWKVLESETSVENIDESILNHKEQLVIRYFTGEKYNAVIVMPLSDGSYLGILIGNKLDKSELNDFDKITLQILLQVFSSAHNSFLNQLKEKKLVFELNEKILQLNNLIDADIELSRYDNQNVLFELALERIVSLTNSSSALVRIVKKPDNFIEKQITFPNGLKTENILKNSHKTEYSFDFNHKSYLFVLSEKETRNGATDFSELDKLLLQAISRQVQASIENLYLLSQSLEKERIEKELNLAAAIQQQIIPEELPRIDGYEVAGINIPSREVGGDYYDCIEIGDGRFAVVIADVAGKGISAALLVNTLNAALYSYLEFNLPLTELTEKLNKLIFKASPADKYITFFIAVLNKASGELEMVNAGHNPALLLREDGTLEQIEAGGIGLGMLDFGMPYTGQIIKINSGDKFFLYTDGIPEAMNLKEEEYSDEKMIDFFQKNSKASASDFISSMVNDVKEFVGQAQQSDDITAIILKKP